MKSILDITSLAFYGSNYRQWNFNGILFMLSCYESDLEDVSSILNVPYYTSIHSGSNVSLYALRSNYHKIVDSLDPNYEIKAIHNQNYGLAELHVNPSVVNDLKLLLKLSL